MLLLAESSRWVAGHLLRRVPLLTGGLGVVFLVLTGVLAGGLNRQFYFSWLVASLFVLTVALGSMIFVLIQFVTRAGWSEPPRDAEFFAINSIAYRMALVAAGRYDACISLGTKSEWDIAGATVILAEAGGRASTARGAEFGFNQAKPIVDSVVVAGPAMHEMIREFLDTIERPPGMRW